MGSAPPSTTHVRSKSLLPLISLLLIAGLWVWQAYSVNASALPPELIAAQKALSKNVQNTTNSRASSNSGRAANKSDGESEARRQFEKLLKKTPEDPALYTAIIAVCVTQKHYTLALEYGERGLQACKYASNSERASLLLIMAETWTHAHEAPPQPQALAYARRALELDSENPETLNSYGYILADNARSLGEINRAISYLSRALQIYQNRIDSEGLSRALEFDRVKSDAESVHLASTKDSYGWALYKRGTYDARDYVRAADTLTQAIDDLGDVEDVVPGEVLKELYYHLGCACRAGGRIEQARHALQVALFYDPKYEDALIEMKALLSTTMEANPRKNHIENMQLGDGKTGTDTLITPQVSPIPTRTPDGKPLFQPLPSSPQGKKSTR